MNITQITNSVIPLSGITLDYKSRTITYTGDRPIQRLCEYVLTGPMTGCHRQCPINLFNHGGEDYKIGGVIYDIACTGTPPLGVERETIISILPLQETPPGLPLQLTDRDPASPTPLVSAGQFEMPRAIHFPCGLTVIPLEP